MGRPAAQQPVKLDPLYFSHPKVEPLDTHSRELHLRMICYSARHLTDGVLSHEEAHELAHHAFSPRGLLVTPTVSEKQGLIDTLVVVGLLDVLDDGYALHDYAEHQVTRESILTRRRRERERKRATEFPVHVSARKHEQHAVSSSSDSHSCSSPIAAATEHSPAALSLHEDHITDAVAASESDPIGYVVARLEDEQGYRTRNAIKSVLDKWELRQDAVLEAFASLQAVKERGGPHKGDSAYLVGTLNRMGEKREHAA